MAHGTFITRPNLWLEIQQLSALEDISHHHDNSILLARVDINRIAHHMQCVRVTDEGQYDGTDPGGSELLEDMYRVYEQPWIRTKIGRRRGEYVIVIHPYGD